MIEEAAVQHGGMAPVPRALRELWDLLVQLGRLGPPGAVLYLDGGVVLATPIISTRPLLVGYTAFTSTGAIGSRTIANSRCSAEFPSSHLCTTTEFRMARSGLPLSAAGAWLDFASSTTSIDPDVEAPCASFTDSSSSSPYGAAVALPSGLTLSGSSNPSKCASNLPLACCTAASSIKLRGYTSYASNGALGGRTVANSRCHSEFPGAHLCTTTEFRLARSSIPLTAQGAWLDFAASTTSVAPDIEAPCANFTDSSSSSPYGAAVALPSGLTLSGSSSPSKCASNLPLACCD